MPSPAVVRSIIRQHAPVMLETLDALKERFAAKLVYLKVSAAGLEVGNGARYGDAAIERDFCPYAQIFTHEEAKAEYKAAKQARAGAGRKAARRRA